MTSTFLVAYLIVINFCKYIFLNITNCEVIEPIITHLVSKICVYNIHSREFFFVLQYPSRLLLGVHQCVTAGRENEQNRAQDERRRGGWAEGEEARRLGGGRGGAAAERWERMRSVGNREDARLRPCGSRDIHELGICSRVLFFFPNFD
jgi:hypothetical protein